MAASAVPAGENAVHAKYTNARQFGSCNFRILTAGPTASTCGCQTFWLNTSTQNSRSPGEAWCYCDHHACFHDSIPESRTTHQPVAAMQYGFTSPHPSAVPGQVTEPLGHSQNRNTKASRFQDQELRNTTVTKQKHGWSEDDVHATEQTRESDVDLPSSNSHTRAELCARTTDSRSRLSLPALGDASSHGHASAALALEMFPMIGIAPHPTEDVIGSATEVNTPSVLETPVSRYVVPVAIPAPEEGDHEVNVLNIPPSSTSQILLNKHTKTPAEGKGSIVCVTSSRSDDVRATALSPESAVEQSVKRLLHTESTRQGRATPLPDWQNGLMSCIRRLDVLETFSFSHLPIEEIQDKFELLEGRLLDLESWRQEMDSRDARDSEGSLSCDDRHQVSDHGMNTFDCIHLHDPSLNGNIDFKFCDVEQRLDLLEAALPSYQNPWKLEIVVLPWGRALHGVWKENSNPSLMCSKPHSQSSEWNGVDSPAEHTSESSDPTGEVSTSGLIANWRDYEGPRLFPKAPSPRSIVYKRLYSRGLVRKITITRCGAHDIWKAIDETFSHFTKAQESHGTVGRQRQYGALAQPLVPLRKIHKSSQLQFLKLHELITPASWDISFLSSGVIMNATGGLKRLYVTTPDAYVQSNVNGWTWQRLEQVQNLQSLSVPPESLPIALEDRFGTDAEESCWSYNPKVDSPLSFGSERSSPPSLTGKGLEDRQHCRPRSSSSPTCLPSPAVNQKRNKASPQEHGMSQKRRRVSVSPTPKVGNMNVTPRWSHEPPSSYGRDTRPNDIVGERRTGLTPFAYATPHSDNAVRLHLDAVDGEEDTQRVSNGPDGGGENEWRGLEEEASEHGSGSSAQSPSCYFGLGLYEDDEDDGLTIYEA